jgi:hypothetical protein
VGEILVITYTEGAIVFGTGPIRPIINLPAGVLETRVRQFNYCASEVFLRFADRIEQWDIECFEGPNATGWWEELWRLSVCIARDPFPFTIHFRLTP